MSARQNDAGRLDHSDESQIELLADLLRLQLEGRSSILVAALEVSERYIRGQPSTNPQVLALRTVQAALSTCRSREGI